MEISSQLECSFCHEGTMREDSCGCLTCKKCHRVEGTNCNIAGCQNARFSTCNWDKMTETVKKKQSCGYCPEDKCLLDCEICNPN